MKERIAESLPEDFEAILTYLSDIRETVKAVVPEPRRSAVFKALFDDCMERGRPLTEAEASRILEGAAKL